MSLKQHSARHFNNLQELSTDPMYYVIVDFGTRLKTIRKSQELFGSDPRRVKVVYNERSSRACAVRASLLRPRLHSKYINEFMILADP